MVDRKEKSIESELSILNQNQQTHAKRVIKENQKILDRMTKVDLEEKLISELSIKYEDVKGLDVFSSKIKINSYEVHGEWNDLCRFELTLCKHEGDCDCNCTHLIISGDFMKHSSEFVRSLSLYTNYQITNAQITPKTEPKLISDYSLSILEKGQTNELCTTGTTTIKEKALKDIMENFSFLEKDIKKKTYVFFGLIPITENMLKMFLSDLLTMIRES